MIFFQLTCLSFMADLKNVTAPQDSIRLFNPHHMDYVMEKSRPPSPTLSPIVFLRKADLC